jgi:photosystem II stability/assembly factor-like uncharacterized protein
MGPGEPEADYDASAKSSRARRGLAVIFISLVAIAAIGIAYVRPSPVLSNAPLSIPTSSTYQLEGVDFVNATTGWFDAGRTWTRQLVGDANQRGVYMRFFDSTHSVFALVGNQPQTFHTSDGGRTWSSPPFHLPA